MARVVRNLTVLPAHSRVYLRAVQTTPLPSQPKLILIFRRLHWLPVHKRVQFKLCLLAYKDVHSLAPQYLADFCRPVSSVDARQRLRSATRDNLVIDRTCTKFGARSFAVAAPSEWNRLPHHIRALQSIDFFRAALKTYLFDCS